MDRWYKPFISIIIQRFVNTLLALRSIARRGSGRPRRSRPLHIGRRPRALLVLLAAACTHAPLPRIDGAPAAPPSASEPWRPPRGAVPPEPARAALAALPPDLAPRSDSLTLGEVVDVALRNNPQTQLSWAQARAGAAAYGAATAQRFPTVDASTNAVYSQTTIGQTLGGIGTRRVITPAATLSYLLFDFGGRGGTITAARAAAMALDLTHNATLQDVALQTEVAYFNYHAFRDLAAAARLTLAEADTNVASAQQRNRAGVATIADVLQAQTLRAQAQLDLETVEGNFQIARGALAAAMGLPASTRYALAPVNDSIPVALAAADVDTLINRALANRPDLAAARTQILQAQAEVRVARSAELPSLTLGSTFTHPYSSQRNATGYNFSVNLGVAIPIFNLARPYNVMAAQAQVDASSARANLMRTEVAQQVYTSYFTLQTATQRVRTAAVLLASATRSEQAARERYRAGVGTILDLVTAQSALASARAQQAQSRWLWSGALAQLAHDVGVLGPRGEPSISLSADSTGARR
jgi:outer membrane protein TolC